MCNLIGDRNKDKLKYGGYLDFVPLVFNKATPQLKGRGVAEAHT